MDNIFENAYFGKPYKTRDGRKAIFQTTYPSQIDPSKTVYSFFTEDSSFHVNKDGKMDFKINDDVFSFYECHPECDIVSEWQEPVSEEELDKLIMNIQVHVCEWNFGGIDKTPYKDLTEYVKEKLNDGLLKEWMNYERQNSKN